MPTGNPISREWVIEALSDREWHTQIELINRAGRFLKPEIAARKYYGETRKNYNDKNKSKDPSTTSPEAAILGGTKRILQRALNALLLEGLLEYRGKKNTTSRESRLVGLFCWACKRFQATMTEDGTCGKCPEYCKRCGCVLDDRRDKAASDVDPDAIYCKKCQKRLRSENIERDRAAKAELQQRDRAAKAELLKAKAESPKPKRSRKSKPKQPTQKEPEEFEPAKSEQPTQIVEQPVIPEYYKVHLRFPSLQQELEPKPAPEPEVVPAPIVATELLDDDSPTIIYHSTLKRPKKRRKSPVLKREPEKSTEREPSPPPSEPIIAGSAEAEPSPIELILSPQTQQEESSEILSEQETLEESPQEQQAVHEVTEPEPDVIVDPSTLTKLFGVDIVRKR